MSLILPLAAVVLWILMVCAVFAVSKIPKKERNELKQYLTEIFIYKFIFLFFSVLWFVIILTNSHLFFSIESKYLAVLIAFLGAEASLKWWLYG